MLPQAAFLLNTSGGSGLGLYQIDISFSTTSKAQFLAPGDTVTDKNGSIYSVNSPSGWVGYPANFSNAGTANVVPVTIDVSPANSLALGDATIQTPGQIDVDAQVQTVGSISSSALIEGRTYKYQVSAGWSIGSEANKAEVGDGIIDNAGKVFIITALSGQPGAFSFPFNVVEADKIGDAPNAGNAYLYRGTPNFKFYQGEYLSQLAEDNVRNRDEFITDINLGATTAGASVTGVPTTTISGIAYYELQTSDYLILVQDPGPVTIVLSQFPDDGRAIIVKDAAPSNPNRIANPITILPSGLGKTIDGGNILEILNTRQSYNLIYDTQGSDWAIL
ncbi:hypothetical protein E4G67_02165 [Candidatus Bathyarchaeota archaeon]|nr:MAG: hypothetical protein E4G67_02165 [Candidatus Bathyarchaeota archaeon]